MSRLKLNSTSDMGLFDQASAFTRWTISASLRRRPILRDIFAANVRRLRHEKGLAQHDLAYEAGVSRSY